MEELRAGLFSTDLPTEFQHQRVFGSLVMLFSIFKSRICSSLRDLIIKDSNSGEILSS